MISFLIFPAGPERASQDHKTLHRSVQTLDIFTEQWVVLGDGMELSGKQSCSASSRSALRAKLHCIMQHTYIDGSRPGGPPHHQRQPSPPRWPASVQHTERVVVKLRSGSAVAFSLFASIVDVIPLPRRPRCRRCESARKRQAQTPGKHRCLGHAARRRRLREPAYSRSTPARNLVSTRLPLSVKKMLSTTHM